MIGIKKVLCSGGRSVRFYKYFLSYIALLFIILSILGGAVYRNFIYTLKAEVEDSNISALIQVRNSMNVRIKELERIAIDIESNPLLANFRISNGGHDSYLGVRELVKYKASNEFIDNIILYRKYQGNEKIYTTDGDIQIDLFFNYLYQFENWGKEDFLDLVSKMKYPSVNPVQDIKINGGNKRGFITYIYPLPISVSKPYNAVLFLIEEKVVKSMLEGVLKNYSGFVYILDEKNNPIIYSSDEKNRNNAIDILQQITVEKLNSSVNNAKINNTVYSIVKVTSEYNNWSYISVMPTDQLLQKVYKKRSIFNLILIAVFMVGIGTAFVFAVGNYKPLKRLTSTLHEQNRNQEVQKFEDEFIFITHVIDEMNKEKKNLMKPQLLFSLFNRKYNSENELKAMIDSSGLRLDKPFFLVLIFFIDDYEQFKDKNSESMQSLMRFGIVDILEDLSRKLANGYGYGVELSDERSIGLLLNIDEEFLGSSHTKELIEKVKAYLRQYFTLTVGVGSAYTNLSMIGDSFQEANRAVYYRLIKGKNQIIHYDEIKEAQKKQYKYPIEEENQLIMTIKQGKSDEIEEITELIKEHIVKQSLSIEAAQCICFGIINSVMKTLDEMDIEINRCFEDKEDISIQHFETLEDLGNRLKEFCQRICSYVEQHKESKNYEMRDKIFDIIKNRYTENTLSLETIATECGVSASYVSRFFKNHTGYPLMRYIDMLRMNEVKQYLKETNLPIKDILEKVGYIDEANFIRKFKKNEGVTPIQYRTITQTELAIKGSEKTN